MELSVICKYSSFTSQPTVEPHQWRTPEEEGVFFSWLWCAPAERLGPVGSAIGLEGHSGSHTSLTTFPANICSQGSFQGKWHLPGNSFWQQLPRVPAGGSLHTYLSLLTVGQLWAGSSQKISLRTTPPMMLGLQLWEGTPFHTGSSLQCLHSALISTRALSAPLSSFPSNPINNFLFSNYWWCLSPDGTLTGIDT